jgi:hypothetical protein
MIAGNYTVTARDSWTTVPGHHVNMTYNANNDPTEEFFFDGENLVFVRRYQYDENGNAILITCTTE